MNWNEPRVTGAYVRRSAMVSMPSAQLCTVDDVWFRSEQEFLRYAQGVSGKLVRLYDPDEAEWLTSQRTHIPHLRWARDNFKFRGSLKDNPHSLICSTSRVEVICCRRCHNRSGVDKWGYAREADGEWICEICRRFELAKRLYGVDNEFGAPEPCARKRVRMADTVPWIPYGAEPAAVPTMRPPPVRTGLFRRPLPPPPAAAAADLRTAPATVQ